MKLFFAIMMIMLCGITARAQTNSVVSTNVASRVTHIDSDNADFDLNSRTAIYRGDVVVSDPGMKLTCAQLVANLPQSGRINQIIAETNVVIDFTDPKGQKLHATSEKAIYHFSVKNGATNETVTLTGNAKVENSQGWLTGDPIVWNRADGHLTATNPKMIYRQDLNSVLTKTNLPAAKTNQLPTPK